MSTVPPQQIAPELHPHPPQELIVYSHSPIFYWWPVWTAGYILAVLTYTQGQTVEFGDATVVIHPSRGVGVFFTTVFLLVIFITHLSVRGIASLTLVLFFITVALALAWLGWWDEVLRVMGSLAIFMNLGFYVFFSSSVFLVWFLSVFGFDRVKAWKFRPGQMVYETAFGTGEQTYDVRGMAVDKLRDDLFRHWILGLGSGDLHITTTGARREEFVIHNVLFVGGKLARIQELAAMRPDETPDVPNAPAAAAAPAGTVTMPQG